MAIDWNTTQHRSVDPFSPVDSDNVSAISAAFTEKGSGRGVSSGLKPEQLSTINIRITKGSAVKDYIVLHFTEDIVINILETNAGSGSNYIVIDYRYEKITPPNVAVIDIIPVASYTQDQYLILGSVEINLAGTEIIEVTTTDRESNPSLKPITEASILELCDTPNYNNGTGLSGQSCGLLVVNDSEDCFEFQKLGDNFCSNNCIISVCKVGNTDIENLLHRDGTNSPSATMNWGGNRLYNLGDPTNDLDAVPLGCLKSCITEEKNARISCDNSLRTDINNIQTDITNIQTHGTDHANDSDCLGGTPSGDYALCNHTHEFKTLICVPGSYGTAGQVLGTDGTQLIWTNVSSGSSGVDNFKALIDTPSALTADCLLGTDGTSVVLKSPADVGSTINLKDLKDVDPNLSPANTQVLAYDSASQKWVACDPATGSGGATTFISLSDTPSSYSSSQNDMFLKVCVDGSGSRIDFVDLSTTINDSIALGDLCDVNVSGGTVGQVLTIVDDGGGGTCWSPQTVSSSGSSTSYEYFHLLHDTPSGYTAADDGKVVTVCYDTSGTQTGLKFSCLSTVINDQININDLKDVDTTGVQNDQVLTAYEDPVTHNITWKPKTVTTSSTTTADYSCFCCLLDVASDIYDNHAPESNPNIATGIPYVVAINSASNGVAACSLSTLFTSIVEDSYLYQLKDVNSAVQTPVDNSVLIYDSQSWCFKRLCSWDLYDVELPNPSNPGEAPADGSVLCWNSSALKWCIGSVSTDNLRNSLCLKDLKDVTDNLAPGSDYVLTYETANGCNKWVAKPVQNPELSFNIICGTDIPPSTGNPGDIYIQYVM